MRERVGGWVALALVLGGLASAAGQGAGGDDRLWWGRVQLSGPLEALRLDCGEDGVTTLRASLVAGEQRTLAVPVPVRSPLGAVGLGSLPEPALSARGAGQARWLGWGDEQPAARGARLPRPLRTRSRPPAAEARGGRGPGPLALLLGLLALLATQARHPARRLLLGAAGGAGLAWLGASGATTTAARLVLELEFGNPRGLAVSAFDGQAPLAEATLAEPGGVRLERRPGVGAVQLELWLEGDRLRGRARSAGARLWLVQEVPAPTLEPGHNGLGALAACWTRSGDGAWRAHGAWPAGGELRPPGASGPESAPPGWLATGLAPGRGVLLGRRDDAQDEESWVRVLGFPVRGP